jgi:transposase
MFSYVSPEERVPQDHPLRSIRRMADQALKSLAARFDTLYAKTGRPSVAPEKLLRALLLQVLYSIRSERMLMEQLDYNLLFRWFVGLNMDDPIWVPTVFTKNRDRMLEGDIAQAFFEQVLAQARTSNLLSDEHFSVDGTLIEAWASKKSYQQKQDPPEAGEGSGRGGKVLKRDQYESRTEPEARLYKKSGGAEAKLSYLGHALMENRNGLVVGALVTQSSTYAEREAALELLARQKRAGRRITVAADTAYDEREFVKKLRALQVTPHVTQYSKRPSAIDGRTTRHAGYAVSQNRRRWIERSFGWMKTVGLLRRARLKGRALVESCFQFSALAFNLVRIRNLILLQAA